MRYLSLLLLLLWLLPAKAVDKNDYFKITVVDEATGRGIPLVELRTTGDVRYYTDSNGVAAFQEPGLTGQSVYFSLKSHGYEFPADGFGYRGQALKVTPGAGAVLKMKRQNVAERLYRETGEGIYRDSVLTGQPVPLAQPLLNGGVLGQDTVMVAPYHGKLFWLWGDTNRASYPLGNFATTSATSEVPGHGGLDPAVGVNFTYYVDKDGFAKKMCPLDGPGPVWLSGLMTATDARGAERLLAHYTRIKNLGEAYEQGLVIFNDATQTFERLKQLDLHAPLVPDGHPVRVRADGKDYYYFGQPYSCMRVQADMAHITDPAVYEAYTCLAPGARYDKAAPQLDRAADGHLVYGWKADTAFVSPGQQQQLIASGKIKPEEALLQLRDVDTGAPVQAHAGSVFWNTYRKRWILIGEQTGGTSLLGELWFAEADTPVGPWVYARKIVTHDKYTFYNPTQHPYFDQDGGRLIYFEGTYTDFISGVTDITPRYNYNQIMYRLALDDRRLALPVPVYQVKAAGGTHRYLLRAGVEAMHAWPNVESIPFFVVPPERKYDGLIPIASGDTVLGYGLPATANAATPTVPLFVQQDAASGQTVFAADANRDIEPLKPATLPLCRVWKNPAAAVLLDYAAQPG